MITLKRFEKAFEELDYAFLANYYLENKEFLVELYKYSTTVEDKWLINKLTDYLNEE